MTIYSQHPNRGKVQILATYRGSIGVVSSTITSVDDPVVARPIVDALNRISACATLPVSVYDRRDGQFEHYPADHIAALTDQSARVSLLGGSHSLWYVQVKVLLHQALNDLDNAMAGVPAPVQTAITAELEAEARGLHDALAEYSEGIEPPESEDRRHWEFAAPFVVLDGRDDGLGQEVRDRLDRVEQDISTERLRKGAADLRLLLDVYERCTSNEARLLIEHFSITDDPFDPGPDRLFLNVDAPMPGGAYGRDVWRVDICQWVLDDPEDEDGRATGEPMLRCALSAPPTVPEVVELLNRSGGRSEQLTEWSRTPVGKVLDGTTFVVTERYDV